MHYTTPTVQFTKEKVCIQPTETCCTSVTRTSHSNLVGKYVIALYVYIGNHAKPERKPY